MIYPEGSPDRDAELERAAEARRMWAELRAEQSLAGVHPVFVPILRTIQQIHTLPVDLTAPEYRECPECGERGEHVCRAKE